MENLSPNPVISNPISLVIGAYGAGNLGDDLLYLAAANIESMAGFQPVCCGYHPPQVKIKPKFCYLAQAADFISSLPLGSRVVLGGGGLFWSEESTARFSALIALAKMKGLGTAVHGIGVQGPGAALTTSLRLLHDSADHFSVRDQPSLDIMRNAVGSEHKIQMLGDLVARPSGDFLFKKVKRRQHKIGSIKVGLNLAWPRVSQDLGFRYHTCLCIANAARQLSSEVEFVYVPQVMHKISMDEQCLIFAEWLRVSSDGLIKTPAVPATAESFLSSVARCDLVLASRFHTGIAAKQIGIPFAMLCINEDDKLDKYHSFSEANNRLSIRFDQHHWEVTDSIVNAVKGMRAELQTVSIAPPV